MKPTRSLKLNKKNWAAYLAAGAASAYGATDAEAGITVITPGAVLTDPNPGDGNLFVTTVQLGGVAGATASFSHYFFGTGDGLLYMRGAGNINVAGFVAGNYEYPSNLAYGQDIGGLTDLLDITDAAVRGDIAWADGFANSQFVNTGGFLGFHFDVGAGTQFGWAELSLTAGPPTNEFVLERVAWADAGESLAAGQTTAVPEPSALGVLALGAVGVSAWRRRRVAEKS